MASWRVTNPWLTRRVLAYAHQGGAKEAPSSTMYAFRRAVELGCPALEMDVHRSADGHLVVTHDETVDRTTNATGRISELPIDALLELDNAHWFVPGADVVAGLHADAYPLRGRRSSDPSLGITRLEAVLDEFPDVLLNFDIKETAPTVEPFEEQLADVLRAYGRVDDVIVASFHDVALRRFRAYAPEIHTSLGPDDVLALGIAIAGEGPEPTLHPSAVAVQVPESFGRHPIVTPAFVEGAHQRGLAVHVWTVDDAHDMRRLVEYEIDGIISDVPSVLLDVLRTA